MTMININEFCDAKKSLKEPEDIIYDMTPFEYDQSTEIVERFWYRKTER